jgi:hypothetical protein
MWALGTLRAMGVPMDLRQVKGVTEELLSLLSHKNYEPLRVHACPMDVAMLLKGLSLLKHRPKDKGLLPALARFAETHASSFTAQDIQVSKSWCLMLGLGWCSWVTGMHFICVRL